jgi:hypothetical protein
VVAHTDQLGLDCTGVQARKDGFDSRPIHVNVTQTRLQSGDTQLVAWLDKAISPGSLVTLKNSDEAERWWTVVDTYATQDVSSINRGWNNNI